MNERREQRRGRLAGIALAALACVLGLSVFVSSAPGAAAPNGFVVEPVVSGLDNPIAISFADDGTMYIAEQRGVIRVFRNGSLLSKPFIDISADVNNRGEHGLLGLTLDPDFPAKPYVYALYTYDPPGLPKDAAGARVARLERITAKASDLDVAASGAAARTVLMGKNGDASAIPNPDPPADQGSPNVSCRRNGARVEDCIPQDGYRHQIGTVTFGPDGALYVGNGDVDRLPNGPLDPHNFIGAIMRIDPQTGNGLPDNPFYDGDPTSNISKAWVYGLKNPFRFGFDPVSGQMFIGEVGAQTWESIELGKSGKDYGWPCYEGGEHVYATYQTTGICQPEYAAGPRPPLYSYTHPPDGAAIIGGDWYHGTSYPQAYRGGYFFADYIQGWVRYLQPDGAGGYAAHDFASGPTASGIVQLLTGPDTDLYWVSLNNGTVYRLHYGNSGPPQTKITKDPPHRTHKHKVKYKFVSDQPGSSFECKIDKKRFKSCGSPKKVKHLHNGKHRFKVRAVNAAGKADPSPAKDKFKVLR